MLPEPEWAPLIPHQGAMCLLDDVIAWNVTRLHARSGSHRRSDNPLRTEDMLHAVNLCEYAAQAMAVHGALRAQATGGAVRPGYLVALRDVRLRVERIDDLIGALQVHVESLLALADSRQYAFRVEHRGMVLATGRAAVIFHSA